MVFTYAKMCYCAYNVDKTQECSALLTQSFSHSQCSEVKRKPEHITETNMNIYNVRTVTKLRAKKPVLQPLAMDVELSPSGMYIVDIQYGTPKGTTNQKNQILRSLYSPIVNVFLCQVSHV